MRSFFGLAVWSVFVVYPMMDGVRAIKYQVFRGTPDSVRVFLKEAANAILFGLVVWRVFVVCPVTDGVRAIKYQVYRGTPDSVRVFLKEAANAVLFWSSCLECFRGLSHDGWCPGY